MAKKTIKVADKPTLDEVKSLLINDEYGLSALKTLVDTWANDNKSISTIQCTLGNTTSQSIWLPKDAKIYAPVELVAGTNCVFSTDHLVVSEDGVATFSASTTDSTVALSIIC